MAAFARGTAVDAAAAAGSGHRRTIHVAATGRRSGIAAR